MTILLTDKEIESMVNEQKSAPPDLMSMGQFKPKRRHKEKHVNVLGASQNAFRIILRQNEINRLDFSIILAVRLPQSNKFFRLRRYNGKSHEHTNHIEKETFFDHHIHFATERYQNSGAREDAYAERTSRYKDIYGALECLITDAHLVIPSGSQRMLLSDKNDLN